MTIWDGERSPNAMKDWPPVAARTMSPPSNPWKRLTSGSNVHEGDTVRLISGGPTMTVTGIEDKSRAMYSHIRLNVCWFDNNQHVQIAQFRDILLERLESGT